MSVIESLARQLAESRVSARSLVEEALTRALDPAGEGARTFISIDREGARETADHVDRLRRRGRAPSPFAGIPMSVKDLFDLAGEVTRAGSVILKEEAPATVDALAIARLKSYGFIVLGRTNMTEFAYSGVGLNPHYGTPLCVYDRATGRISRRLVRPARRSRSPTRSALSVSAPIPVGHAASRRRSTALSGGSRRLAGCRRVASIPCPPPSIGRSARSHGDRLLRACRRDHGR